MKLINIMGTNALGKSTRITYLVKYLQNTYNEEIIYWNTVKGEKNIGRLYDNKYFILGDFNKKGAWIGLDLAHFTTIDSRMKLYKDISEKYPTIELFIQEGYFNNGSKRYNMTEFCNCNIDSYDYYIFYYDNVQQFLDRCNARTGREHRGLDWAENSQGWRDNAGYKRSVDYFKGLNEEGCNVYGLKLDEPKTYFIKELFGIDVDEEDIDVLLEQCLEAEKDVEKRVDKILNTLI